MMRAAPIPLPETSATTSPTVPPRHAEAVSLDRIRRKEPPLDGPRELEFLLGKLRFLQAGDALAQTFLQGPEEIEDEPEKEAERARDAEREADVPGGEVDPCQPRGLRDEESDAPTKAAAEKEDDRGHERSREDFAPADRFADEREEGAAADEDREAAQGAVRRQAPAEELRPGKDAQKDDPDAHEGREHGFAKRCPAGPKRGTRVRHGCHAVSYGRDGYRVYCGERRDARFPRNRSGSRRTARPSGRGRLDFRRFNRTVSLTARPSPLA